MAAHMMLSDMARIMCQCGDAAGHVSEHCGVLDRVQQMHRMSGKSEQEMLSRRWVRTTGAGGASRFAEHGRCLRCIGWQSCIALHCSAAMLELWPATRHAITEMAQESKASRHFGSGPD